MFDIVTEEDMAALRLLFKADPDPEMDPSMRQVNCLAIVLKDALGDKHYLRHDVLRIITGVPIVSQWGLSNWYHHQLINFIKAKENDKKGKFKASTRGRRLVLESARIAETVISEYEDDMERRETEAGLWDLREGSNVLTGHA